MSQITHRQALREILDAIEGGADLSDMEYYKPRLDRWRAALAQEDPIVEALKTLCSLYAATPGHDPAFIAKAFAAIAHHSKEPA